MKEMDRESTSEVDDDKNWVDGDVHLISSDRVRFCVPGYLLAWARYIQCGIRADSGSPVFADVLSLPGGDEGKELALTDSSFEVADTIRLFLKLVSPNDFDMTAFLSLSQKTLSRELLRLTAFLDKYNSEVGARMLRLYGSEVILRHTEEPPWCEGQVVFACMTNDLGLCTHLIQKHALRVWAPQDPVKDQPLGAHKSGCFFSLTQAPFDFVSSLPFPYQWAMGRASLQVSSATETDKFCQKFVGIVTTILERSDGRFALCLSDRADGAHGVLLRC